MSRTFKMALNLGSETYYQKSVRKTWAIKPLTHVVSSKKVYDRNRENRAWKREQE